jgi:hypothetical protein
MEVFGIFDFLIKFLISETTKRHSPGEGHIVSAMEHDSLTSSLGWTRAKEAVKQ